MGRSALEEALAQQARPDASRGEELAVVNAMLGAIAERKKMRSAAGLFLELQRHQHSVALTRLDWRQTKRDFFEARGPNDALFIITFADDGDDDYRLIAGWPGYGSMLAGTGSKSELEHRAQKIAREGGPFGGPDPEDSDPYRWFEWRSTRGFRRRGGLAGEFIIDIGHHFPRERDDLALYCAYRDGSFACVARGAERNLASIGDKLAEDERVRQLYPAITARVGRHSLPWSFLDFGIFKGKLSTPILDVVLIDVRLGWHAMLCSFVDGQHQAVALRPLEDIQRFDLGPILIALMGKQAFDEWLTIERLKPPPSDRPPVEDRRGPATAVPTVVRPASSPPPAGPNVIGAALLRPLAAESSNPAAAMQPVRPASTRPSAPPSQPIDLNAVVLEHLKLFHQRLPAGENGVATARALLLGIVRAYMSGRPSIEGTWRELFGAFVESGDLDDMPSDKTARAALNILKASPLVRRVDHQRWRICLDEARDPRSELIQLLAREHLERAP